MRSSESHRVIGAVCTAALLLLGCGGSGGTPSEPTHVGTWVHAWSDSTSWESVLNLRADGYFSIVKWDVDDPANPVFEDAQRGTYSVDGTGAAGTLTLHLTHYYGGSGWAPADQSWIDSYGTIPYEYGVDPDTHVRTISRTGESFVYRGGATAIPETL